MVRAQELRFAWERFVAEDEASGDVREPIADSWRRSRRRAWTRRAAALAPVVADEGETHERWEEHPLRAHAPLIHACLSAIADECRLPDRRQRRERDAAERSRATRTSACAPPAT